MASASGKSTSRSRATANKGTAKNTKNTGKRTTGTNTRQTVDSRGGARKDVDMAVKNEVMLIGIFAIAIFVFLCVTGLIHGAAANGIRNVMFGLFGLLAYAVPVIVFVGFAFGISNRGNTVAVVKLVSGVVLVFLLGILCYMLTGQHGDIESGSVVRDIYVSSRDNRSGGGVLFGLLAYGLYKLIGFGGTLFAVFVLAIISLVFITEKSFISGVKKGSAYIIETAKEDAVRMREYRQSLREEYDEELEAYEEEEPEESQRRVDKKTRGVIASSAINLKAKNTSDSATAIKRDIHEITILDDGNASDVLEEDISVKPMGVDSVPTENFFAEDISEEPVYDEPVYEESVYDEPAFEEPIPEDTFLEDGFSDETFAESDFFADDDFVQINAEALERMPEPVTEHTVLEKKETEFLKADEPEQEEINFLQAKAIQTERKYEFPPIDLLKKGDGKKGDSSNQLKETALRLQQTLQTFGVKVTITDISQGPSVTRYEMQPEQGVKVSKIVGLADDIKLNLAATDIRIEAPIPGKAAVGIEVPNKENSAVALRDLLETDIFQKFPSNLAFAVGKDIAGQTVVTDIAKMPHVLIAGATGSGKSVCINTIIMSILYKADPSDVKLIMIDPKVVELSVYNGIPHLMIPVVTDPKKASAALNWGVTEMDDRYRKFAELGVRDLKGYNKAAESGKLFPDGQPVQKMPQILIIVDELADLMMVASGEVEASICRLAQLARACGIHLVIATQRPSVDVITGLIKANMPSRIAFSVSSGVDSRTILDMNGAEKLLGKGDMLFYPQGYPKPARVQGAFVSDSEVSDVVDFLKNQMLGNNTYNSDIEDKIKTMQSAGGASGGAAGGANDTDAYFADAGKFVIEKDKASIGMLQRVFKIGFNRAARIVDQLEEAGVVGAEEGTKPRRILMSMEQFENYLEEHG
ncbi:MAG: DNA translocase FtsK [Lachnospiraceae bacterium]|nr:DNA translocase FtsK [Lachnospiraceae bacterium]